MCGLTKDKWPKELLSPYLYNDTQCHGKSLEGVIFSSSVGQHLLPVLQDVSVLKAEETE